MIKAHRFCPSPIFFSTLAAIAMLSHSGNSSAWGQDGHTAIGILAVNQLQPAALQELESIIQPLNKQAVAQACNWPDEIRETEEGEWSGPLHYVNVPRGIDVYDRDRDCKPHPDHMEHPEGPTRYCVTEAIKHYATRLGHRQAPTEERRQAFAWLCHLVGDLHQPLHAGFADDRGGNDVNVKFKGEEMNLHRFWDAGLIDDKAGSWQYLVGQTVEFPAKPADSNWTQDMVNDWTSESHQLAEYAAYPPKKKIKSSFAEQSWMHIQQQIALAASGLALIINTKFKNEE